MISIVKMLWILRKVNYLEINLKEDGERILSLCKSFLYYFLVLNLILLIHFILV
jgi:hypothetical protein